MKMNVEVEIQPFPVPRYVEQKAMVRDRSTDRYIENPRFPLSYVDSNTLAYMCCELVKKIFSESGKPIPEIKIILQQTGENVVASSGHTLYSTNPNDWILPGDSSSGHTLSDNDTRD